VSSIFESTNPFTLPFPLRFGVEINESTGAAEIARIPIDNASLLVENRLPMTHEKLCTKLYFCARISMGSFNKTTPK
jgi:hypothetical protein